MAIGRRSPRGFLLLAVSCSLAVGCGSDGGSGCVLIGSGAAVHPSYEEKPPFNLGLEVWKMFRGQAAKSSHCAEQKTAVWDARRDEFIQAVNTVIPPEDLPWLSVGLKNIFPLVDDETVPKMTKDVGDMLELLYADPQDPDKTALKALLKIAQSKDRIVEMDDLIGLVGRTIRQPEFEEMVMALAQIIRENDGVNDTGQPNGEKDLSSDVLRFLSTKMSEMPSNVPVSLDFVDELVKAADLPGTLNLGEPAWVVKLDKNHNPQVAVDPATGKLYPPFTDFDADGVADVNAKGEPVDINSQPIHIAAFGKEGSRDKYHRALAFGGGLLYVYYDAKRTALAMLWMFVGDLMGEGAHGDARPVLNAALGPRVTNDNGTPGNLADDFEQFNPGPNPVLDLAWGGWEILRYGDVALLLKTIAQLIQQNQALGESLLIDINKILKALNDSTFLQNAQDLNSILDLTDGMLPLMDGIFETPNGSAISTARLLMNTYVGLGQEAIALPSQIALTMKYRKLKKTSPGGPLDLANSTPVDFNLPMYVNGADNRSSFEQSIALLVGVDGPALPLIGKSIAELTLQTMAGADPTTVSNLIQLTLGLASLPLSEVLAVAALNLLGYDGQLVWNNLQSLDALAKSGALDGYLPLAKAFVDQGQTRLLLQFIRKIYEDLQKDLDSFPVTYSVVRKGEPFFIELFNGPTPQHLYDMIQKFIALPVNGGPSTAADLIADAIANLVDDDTVVKRRDGTLAPCRARLLTDPVREIAKRNDAAGQFPKLRHVVTTTVDLLSQTVTVNGAAQLKRRGLVAVFAAVATFAGKLMDMSAAERDSYVEKQRAEFHDLITAKGGSQVMYLWDAVDASPGAAKLYEALRKFFIPNTTSAQLDAFGAEMRLMAQLGGKNVDVGLLRDVTRYLAKVLEPSSGTVTDLVKGLDRVIRLDYTKSVLKLLQNLFWQGEDGLSKAPASTLLSILDDMRKIDEETCIVAPAAPDLTAAEAEKLIKQLVFFLRDDKVGGVPSIYSIVKNRNK